MDMTEDVDFDFFDTPRNDNLSSPGSKKMLDKKPPNPASLQRKNGDLSNGKQSRNDKTAESRISQSSKQNSDYDYSDDTFMSSSSESETPRYEKGKAQTKESKKNVEKVEKQENSMSESSSAYSDSVNSVYSSDENDQYEKYSRKEKKEMIDVHVPRAHVEAWGCEGNNKTDNDRKRFSGSKDRKERRRRSVSDSSDSESDSDHDKHESRNSSQRRNDRAKSAKDRNRKSYDRKKTLRSSSSYSNNSDITDVSPLESPENSPRHSRKRSKNREDRKDNGKSENVQYSNSSSPERDVNHSINLESDQIDLSILMKCMADIDREKQQRLKTNSRRVMFAPPAAGAKNKANYTYSMGRAKMIEKENQRLLKQIMMQMNSNTVKKAPGATPHPKGPKRAVEPAVQRLTPSAVNRMREQRRIEAENMHILQRLQTVRPTRGMSRNEQILEAERQMSYGIPSGTVIIPGQRSHYDTLSKSSLQGSVSNVAGSTQRSRPSSAKSNASTVVTPGKRSRPSSAKSNASIRSNASMRSNVSKRSTVSMRSGIVVPGVRRMADGRIDNRPQWDDRFSFS